VIGHGKSFPCVVEEAHGADAEGIDGNAPRETRPVLRSASTLQGRMRRPRKSLFNVDRSFPRSVEVKIPTLYAR
jgi:hypothetical protein